MKSQEAFLLLLHVNVKACAKDKAHSGHNNKAMCLTVSPEVSWCGGH